MGLFLFFDCMDVCKCIEQIFGGGKQDYQIDDQVGL